MLHTYIREVHCPNPDDLLAEMFSDLVQSSLGNSRMKDCIFRDRLHSVTCLLSIRYHITVCFDAIQHLHLKQHR
jgi:hypothetical protein